MTMTENDDTVLEQLRQVCSDRSAHPDEAGDLPRLYALRDEALARGLPLPSSCPMDSVRA